MMKMMKWMLAVGLMVSGVTYSAVAMDDDLFARAPWFGTLGVSYYHLEGDVEAKPGVGLMGKRYVGCEINPVHFATARARLENELRQGLLPLTHNKDLRLK
jgi:hypothetical protein